MLNDPTKAAPRPGYLLLRDGHAIPLCGISPDELKVGAKHRVLHPEKDSLKHRETLTAIVKCLGFSGDFGTFQSEGWPKFQDFLKENGCTHRAGLFPVDHGGSIDLCFYGSFAPHPRDLADRLFEAPLSAPQRVFLGYGVNWAAWDQGRGNHASSAAINSIISNTIDWETAYQRANDLFARRHYLPFQWGFLDDKLIHGPVRHVVDKNCFEPDTDPEARKAHLAEVTAAVLAFRAVFDPQPEGWVNILRYNDRLLVLRGHDGGWDILWRNYREKEPPQSSLVGSSFEVAIQRMAAHTNRTLYFLKWEEQEMHELMQASCKVNSKVQNGAPSQDNFSLTDLKACSESFSP